MPTNRELIAEAKALGEELGVETSTDGLNNARLTALVDELRAQRDARVGGPVAPPQPPQPAPPRPAEEASTVDSSSPFTTTAEDERGAGGDAGGNELAAPSNPTSYIVAKGRSITSKRGILSEGMAVEAKYFSGGEDTLNTLVKRGSVVES